MSNMETGRDNPGESITSKNSTGEYFFISDNNFDLFLEQLIGALPVMAPVAKGPLFSFEFLDRAEQIRLDYDVTILPPKKAFFPPQQVILRFNQGQFEAAVNPQKQVLLGVHPYDIKAIDQTDFLYTENYEDINYTAYRNATTLIGSNIQRVSQRAFWGSISHRVEMRGQDGFLTHLPPWQGYLYQVFTDKGRELLDFGNFNAATKEQLTAAQEYNERIKEQCPEQLDYDLTTLAQTIRQSFKNNALWEELAADCFSCGSCNTTCPTCYCFNIEDNWNLDQQSGQRTRYWDSCMTEDFAKISSGGGHSENFRETPGQRMRHRIMRKLVYLNEKLGTQACVGCGRCSLSCTADIADPVHIVERIMQEAANG